VSRDPDRRAFLRLGVAGLVAASPLRALAALGPRGSRPLVGAIRWDAWYAPRDPVTEAVERSLAPPRYHYRLPFFAKVKPDSSVEIDGGHRETIDREIAYAERAGLDYWAFVWYGPASPMNTALRLYRDSPRHRAVNFCLIATLGQWNGRGGYHDVVAQQAEYTADPAYQRVLEGRPLFYLAFVTPEIVQRDWGVIDAVRDAVGVLRDAVRGKSGATPYVVLMATGAAGAGELAKKVGADAVGAYAPHADRRAAPYARLAAEAVEFWDALAAHGLDVVPTVMTGWDRRPRIEHPVPWEPYQQPGIGLDLYYETARPDQIAAHLRNCLRWIDGHPRAAPARVALIYAWNENDEGGWLIPTYPHDTGRIEAVRKALR